jgi:predicted Zn-dependent peptidase
VPRSTKLPSGATLVTLDRRTLPLVHVLVAVDAGASLDPRDRPGLAAATAMMLQDGGAGSRSAPEVAAAIEDLGAELRVDCDRDGVVLHMTVLSAHLEAALALVGDLLARPRFDEAEWTRARARRVAEILRRDDEPRHIADMVFDRELYGEGHPYGRPPLGTAATVEKLSVRDLRDFYAKHYGPRTTTLILVGDVEAAATEGRVEHALAGWSSTAEPSQPVAASADGPEGGRLVLIDRPGAPQSELRIGHMGRARATPQFPSLSLLETVLGGSFTSRLNQNLREKHGYTYGVRAQFLLYEAPGPFEVRTAVRTDVTVPAIREILGELKAIRSPISDGELVKGRALVRGNLVDGFASGPEATALLGDLVLHRLPLDGWSRLPAALERLTIAALSHDAADLFHPERLTVVVVGDLAKVASPLEALGFPHVERLDVHGAPLPAKK